jgi:hypothetical protein
MREPALPRPTPRTAMPPPRRWRGRFVPEEKPLRSFTIRWSDMATSATAWTNFGARRTRPNWRYEIVMKWSNLPVEQRQRLPLQASPRKMTPYTGTSNGPHRIPASGTSRRRVEDTLAPSHVPNNPESLTPAVPTKPRYSCKHPTSAAVLGRIEAAEARVSDLIFLSNTLLTSACPAPSSPAIG